MTTLNDILKEHPEWGDLPVGILLNGGDMQFIDFNDDTRAGVFDSDWWDDEKTSIEDYDDNGEFIGEKINILIFTPN